MKLPNGYGSVVKLSGKRRRPYQVRKTTGWHYDKEKDKQVQDMITIGYAATKAEALQMLAEYNNNPFDTKAAKMTFSDVYEEWSKRKFPTISESNVKGYSASYKACESLLLFCKLNHSLMCWWSKWQNVRVLFCKLNDAPVVTLNDAVTV